jgi:hypothetical protein
LIKLVFQGFHWMLRFVACSTWEGGVGMQLGSMSGKHVCLVAWKDHWRKGPETYRLPQCVVISFSFELLFFHFVANFEFIFCLLLFFSSLYLMKFLSLRSHKNWIFPCPRSDAWVGIALMKAWERVFLAEGTACTKAWR